MIKKIVAFCVCMFPIYMHGTDQNKDGHASVACSSSSSRHALSQEKIVEQIQNLARKLSPENRELVAQNIVRENRQLKIMACFNMCFRDLFGNSRGVHNND